MTTDSENNMMNQLFSLHSFGGRRFFLLLLLLANFQIVHGICKPNEASSSDTSPSSTTLFISEGTIVSGMEQVYIPNSKKEKIKKVSKIKSSFVSHKRKFKKEQGFSQSTKNSNRSSFIFSRNTQSEKSLLAGSDNDQQIIRPNQHTKKFFLADSENKMPILSDLLDIFQKKIYKSHWVSHLKFFRNFKRPPPFLHGAIA